MKRLVPILFAMAVLVTQMRATTFESGETQTALLELYTSEGCSSCPPAEARLGKLRGDAGLWKQVVPVAFHVDYWDNLGWADRFASAAFTRRQYDYAARWGTGTVYTPAFVQNGREGTDATPNTRPGKLRAETGPGGKLTVTFQPTVSSSSGLVAEIAPLASGITSDVRRGENAGRKLTHEFIALDLLHAPLERHGGAWSATLVLPSKTVAPVSAMAVWVHTTDDPTALQAVGGWLEK